MKNKRTNLKMSTSNLEQSSPLSSGSDMTSTDTVVSENLIESYAVMVRELDKTLWPTVVRSKMNMDKWIEAL